MNRKELAFVEHALVKIIANTHVKSWTLVALLPVIMRLLHIRGRKRVMHRLNNKEI